MGFYWAGSMGGFFKGNHVDQIIQPLLRSPLQPLQDLPTILIVGAYHRKFEVEAAGFQQPFEGNNTERNLAALPTRDGGLSRSDSPTQRSLTETGLQPCFLDELMGSHTQNIITFLLCTQCSKFQLV